MKTFPKKKVTTKKKKTMSKVTEQGSAVKILWNFKTPDGLFFFRSYWLCLCGLYIISFGIMIAGCVTGTLKNEHLDWWVFFLFAFFDAFFIYPVTLVAAWIVEPGTMVSLTISKFCLGLIGAGYTYTMYSGWIGFALCIIVYLVAKFKPKIVETEEKS
jgi:hypothetical protein